MIADALIEVGLVTGSLRVVSEARRAVRLHEHGVFKSASVRKSSTDEMGVCQELADWCFRPYHGIGPPRGAAAPFYGKVNCGKIKTLYAVLQPAGSRKREGVVQ
jgi:hypothetical protein